MDHEDQSELKEHKKFCRDILVASLGWNLRFMNHEDSNISKVYLLDSLFV